MRFSLPWRHNSAPSQNILLLGLDGGGKTAILSQLLHEDPRTVLPTLGFTVRAFAMRDGHILKLWDIGGAPTLRSYWQHHYSKADALAIVIDASNRRRLAETSSMLQQVLDDERLLGLPLLIVANKQDAAGAIPAGDLEELLHLGSIRDRIWRCIECSAFRGRGIDTGLQWLASVHAPRAKHRSVATHGGSPARATTASPVRGKIGSSRSVLGRAAGAAADDDDDDDEGDDDDDSDAGGRTGNRRATGGSKARRTLDTTAAATTKGTARRLLASRKKAAPTPADADAASSDEDEDDAAPAPAPAAVAAPRGRRERGRTSRGNQRPSPAGSDDDSDA